MLLDFSQILKMLWPLWVFLAVVIVFRIIFEKILPDLFNNWRKRREFRQGEKWRSDRELLQWLRAMKPVEFENYIADLFS